jgi:hypothetical protein
MALICLVSSKRFLAGRSESLVDHNLWLAAAIVSKASTRRLIERVSLRRPCRE